MKILKLSDNEKIDIINRMKERTNILQVVIEKDVWVMAVLKALFSTSCADFMVFKGGTSLSKGWKLIERFSEDIDVAISRDFFGITNIESKNQRDKLRKLSSKYVQEKLISELDEQLKNKGISGYSLAVKPTESSDNDPQTLYVKYKSLFSKNDYTEDSVKIEISCVYEENAIKFDALLHRLEELKQRFRKLNFNEKFFEKLK